MMSEEITAAAAVEKRDLKTWLFNPFRYVAGGWALAAGLAVIAASGVICYYGRLHFDGVLDAHTGPAGPMWVFIAEGIIDWLSLSVLLVIAGYVVPPRRFRMIDILGTQALARWPYLPVAAAMSAPRYQRYLQQLIELQSQGSSAIVVNIWDVVLFYSISVILVVGIIWMVSLMYRGFCVSCQVKGGRAIVVFVVCLAIAEVVLSKIALGVLLGGFMSAP